MTSEIERAIQAVGRAGERCENCTFSFWLETETRDVAGQRMKKWICKRFPPVFFSLYEGVPPYLKPIGSKEDHSLSLGQMAFLDSKKWTYDALFRQPEVYDNGWCGEFRRREHKPKRKERQP